MTVLGEGLEEAFTSTVRYALCGCDDRKGAWRASEVIKAEQWDPDPCSGDGIFGLLDGSGDPKAGSLDEELWAVVAVEKFVDCSTAGRAAIKFPSGQVLFQGDRFAALDFLIALGIDPLRLAVPQSRGLELKVGAVPAFGLAEVGDGAIADAGAFGSARSGSNGLSRVGLGGDALSGSFGIAVSDEQGRATAASFGIAISTGKRFGEAIAGDSGLAIGLERFKFAQAGEAGIAIAERGRASSGPHGLSLSSRGEAYAGPYGVAIGETVCGSSRSLLIAFGAAADGGRLAATGVVGERDIEPNVLYRFGDGRLVRVDPE